MSTTSNVIRVQSDDSRIQYSPDIMSLADGKSLCEGKPGATACLGHWWMQEPGSNPGVDGSSHWTCGRGNGLTFTFSGTSIAWIAVPNYPGPLMNVTLDGGITMQAGRISDTISFRQDGLDPDTNYTLNVIYNGDSASCISLDYFEITNPGANFAASPGHSSPHSSNRAGVIVGLVLGIIVLLTVAFTFLLCYRPRRKPLEQGRDFAEDLSKSVSSTNLLPHNVAKGDEGYGIA